MRRQYFKFCTDSGRELEGVPEWKATRWGSFYNTLTMTLQQWTVVNATQCRALMTEVVNMLKPFNEFTLKMCSSSCLITEVAFIFSEITFILRKCIGEEAGGNFPSIALAKLLLTQMEKRFPYHTESEEMKKLLFFDRRAVQMLYEIKPFLGVPSRLEVHWIESNVLFHSIIKPSRYSWCEKNVKRSESPIEDEIDNYIFGCNRGVTQTTNPLEFWKSNRCIYPNLAERALKSLPIPATSVSARRVFSAVGLLDKELHRSNGKIDESTLLLRLNNIGNLAHEISCQPPLSLIPQSAYSNNNLSTTFGYMTDESDFEEATSDDEEEDV